MEANSLFKSKYEERLRNCLQPYNNIEKTMEFLGDNKNIQEIKMSVGKIFINKMNSFLKDDINWFINEREIVTRRDLKERFRREIEGFKDNLKLMIEQVVERVWEDVVDSCYIDNTAEMLFAMLGKVVDNSVVSTNPSQKEFTESDFTDKPDTERVMEDSVVEDSKKEGVLEDRQSEEIERDRVQESANRKRRLRESFRAKKIENDCSQTKRQNIRQTDVAEEEHGKWHKEAVSKVDVDIYEQRITYEEEQQIHIIDLNSERDNKDFRKKSASLSHKGISNRKGRTKIKSSDELQKIRDK